MTNEPKTCNSVQTTLKVLGGKWKPAILFLLCEQTLRFGQLKRSVSGITQKMLTQELRELEEDGLVSRKVYPQVPPKVEYTVTSYGKTLGPVLKSMSAWGKTHKARVK
ncbi:MAG: helix-turn-helix transcriptional regulator [Candidatus Doudnabacteria bacterium]|nr:helix-turn-helix transcriptional regulator [Candidatus Doudnabacteria bacterium]